jgi:hypothetical protein
MKLEAALRLMAADLEDVRGYIKRLQKLGVKKIGMGSTGWVFQHPANPDVVVKVFKQKSTSNAVKWLEWCKKNRQNPYAPKIYSVHRVELTEPDQNEWFVAFIEKLKPTTKAKIQAMINKHNAQRVMRAGKAPGIWRLEPKYIEDIDDDNLKKIFTSINDIGTPGPLCL